MPAAKRIKAARCPLIQVLSTLVEKRHSHTHRYNTTVLCYGTFVSAGCIMLCKLSQPLVSVHTQHPASQPRSPKSPSNTTNTTRQQAIVPNHLSCEAGAAFGGFCPRSTACCQHYVIRWWIMAHQLSTGASKTTYHTLQEPLLLAKIPGKSSSSTITIMLTPGSDKGLGALTCNCCKTQRA